MSQPLLFDLQGQENSKKALPYIRKWMDDAKEGILFLCPNGEEKNAPARFVNQEGYTLLTSPLPYRSFVSNVAFSALHRNIPLTLITPDPVFLQLVGPRLDVYLLTREKLFTLPSIEEEFGVPPWLLPDLWILKGFPEENIPPCLGLEEEIIVRILETFHSVEELIARLDLLEIHGFPQPFFLQNILARQKDRLLAHTQRIRLRYQADFPLSLAQFKARKKTKLLI